MSVASRRWTRGQRPVERQLTDLENLLGRTPVFHGVRSVTAATTIVDSDDLVLVDNFGIAAVSGRGKIDGVTVKLDS